MEMNLLFQRKGIGESRRFLLSDAIAFGLIVGVFVAEIYCRLSWLISMVSKHMALVGDALSHVALPGLALEYL